MCVVLHDIMVFVFEAELAEHIHTIIVLNKLFQSVRFVFVVGIC
jgi:hypothetical protein